jgi:electron transport complex protein RnfG
MTVVRLTLALGIVFCLASGVLAVANRLTAEPRETALLREQQGALRSVLPPFANDPLKEAVECTTAPDQGESPETVRFFPARDADGRLLALAGEAVSPKGFGGDVKVLVGISPAGEIRTVVVTEQNETPGLGTAATDRKQQKTLADILGRGDERATDGTQVPPSPYLDQYTGRTLSASGFRVSREGGGIEAVSGATISSRAVADAVSRVASAFTANREALLGQGGER